MSDGDLPYAVFYALAAILPISALMARRMAWQRVLVLAVAWIAIIGLAAIVANLGRNGFADGWDRMIALVKDDDQRVTGGAIRIRMADDGHFWATAQINGVARRMLIDSGATTTALSVATAEASGIVRDEGGFPTVLNTANGRVAADVATADTLTLGPIVAQHLRVVVSPAFGDTDVLGMNFLSRLGEWHVEGKTLVMSAPAHHD